MASSPYAKAPPIQKLVIGSARANTHPLRISILEVLGLDGGRELSPSDLSYELRTPLSNINYHTTELYKSGLLTLVKTRPVRGATEHFYRLAEPEPNGNGNGASNGNGNGNINGGGATGGGVMSGSVESKSEYTRSRSFNKKDVASSAPADINMDWRNQTQNSQSQVPSPAQSPSVAGVTIAPSRMSSIYLFPLFTNFLKHGLSHLFSTLPYKAWGFITVVLLLSLFPFKLQMAGSMVAPS